MLVRIPGSCSWEMTCKEEIQDGALKCKHCASMLMSTPRPSSGKHAKPEHLWLPIPALIFAALSVLALLDPAPVDQDTITGGIMLSASGLGLGIASVAKQARGKGMAITGIVLGGIGLLIWLGMLP